MRRTTVLCVLIAAAIATPVLAADTAEADAAFDAGDHARALELYERVLSVDPDNAHALLRSAMLLSWDRKFTEAVRRYDRLLDLNPRDRKAAFERAKVLSWDRKYADAKAAFYRLLLNDPGDRDARLGLARTLSWSGSQMAARDEYMKVLTSSPDDVEALVGVAQTYAWSGDPYRARSYYERALKLQPGFKDAELGIAYLDLGSGDASTAEQRAGELESANAGDQEVKALRDEVRRARAPWVQASWDRVEDSDENLMNVYRVEGGRSLGVSADLTLGIARYNMTSPGLFSFIDTLYAVGGFHTGRGQRLTLRLGVERWSNSAEVRTNEPTAGMAWVHGLDRRWQLTASVDHDTLRYSPTILDNGITMNTYAVRVAASPVRRWRITGGVGVGDFSDGNTKTFADLGAVYSVPVPRGALESGYAFRYMNYGEDLGNGYFAPRNFVANLLQLRWRDGLPAERFYWDLSAETGVQSFTQRATHVSNDWVAVGMAVLGCRFARDWRIEGYAGYSSYAAQTATGFTSRNVGLRLRWQDGR
jgi:tetratricopeptide (TPR) repeat protein